MKKFLVLVLCFFVLGPAFAGGLSEKTQSMSVDISYVDAEDLIKSTEIGVGWAYGFKEGLLQVGAGFSYFDEELEGFESVDGMSIGPLIAVNFMPDAKATPFIGATVFALSGDLGDLYDFGYSAALGLKAFIGNSASLDISLGFETLNSDLWFLDDQDSISLNVGVSFYFGSR